MQDCDGGRGGEARQEGIGGILYAPTIFGSAFSGEGRRERGRRHSGSRRDESISVGGAAGVRRGGEMGTGGRRMVPGGGKAACAALCFVCTAPGAVAHSLLLRC